MRTNTIDAKYALAISLKRVDQHHDRGDRLGGLRGQTVGKLWGMSENSCDVTLWWTDYGGSSYLLDGKYTLVLPGKGIRRCGLARMWCFNLAA